MRISEQEYLDALKIVERYIQQIAEEKRAAVKLKEGELVYDWANRNHYRLSSRLYNGLMAGYGKNSPKHNVFIEELTKDDFLLLRNIGETSWEELIKFRG